MSKEIYIIRHGATDINTVGQALGSVDVPLNTVGVRDVVELGDDLRSRGVRPDVVISSPLERALSTANIIQAILGGGKMETSAFLKEIDYGGYEGADNTILQKIKYGYSTESMLTGGGETVEVIEERVRQLLEELLKRPESSFLLVTHAFTASVLQQILLGEPRDFAHIQPLATADYTHAVVEKGGENEVILIVMQRNVRKGPLQL